MKRLFTIVTLLASLATSLPAQDSMAGNPKLLRVKVVTLRQHVNHGYLYAMSDTALLLSSEKRLPQFADTALRAGIRSYGYPDMEYVIVTRKGQIGRSTLAGLGIGIGVGALLGLAGGDDPENQFFTMTAGEKALAAGILGGTIGTITGLIVGAAKRKAYNIQGKRKNYQKMRGKLMTKLDL